MSHTYKKIQRAERMRFGEEAFATLERTWELLGFQAARAI